jgi:hypothetical protein
VLTRLDAGAVVAALFVAWGISLGDSWRRSLVAWGVCGLLVAPLLAGYLLRHGDVLTPFGSSLGGDIRDAMAPLLRGDVPAPTALRYLLAGTYFTYAHVIFGSALGYLPWSLASPAGAVALAGLVGGTIVLLWRGPRLPAVLVWLGSVAPPFAYLAGVSWLGGPGGGYTERYTYLVLPAALAVAAWAVLSTGSHAATVLRRRVKTRSPPPPAPPLDTTQPATPAGPTRAPVHPGERDQAPV